MVFLSVIPSYLLSALLLLVIVDCKNAIPALTVFFVCAWSWGDGVYEVRDVSGEFFVLYVLNPLTVGTPFPANEAGNPPFGVNGLVLVNPPFWLIWGWFWLFWNSAIFWVYCSFLFCTSLLFWI